MLSLLTASFLAFVPLSQEPPTPAQPAPEAAQEPAAEKAPAKRGSRRKPQMAPNDADATAFLAKLVSAQRIAEDLDPITAFRMEFGLKDYHPDRGMNQLDVRVDFRSADAPRRDAAVDENGQPLQGFEEIRLTAHDPSFNEQVSKGLDADGYWLRDDTGKLISLEAKEYANDRSAIDQTLTLCEDFLLLFDLEQLSQRAGGLKLRSSESETILSGELMRGREVWRFRLVVIDGEALPSQLVLELPESSRAKSEPAQPSDPDAAVAEPQDAAKDPVGPTVSAEPAPQVINYFFYDWMPHAGRLLPIAIDEFHGVMTPDTLQRRSIDMKRFLWSVPAEIKTWRGKDPVAEKSGETPMETPR